MRQLSLQQDDVIDSLKSQLSEAQNRIEQLEKESQEGRSREVHDVHDDEDEILQVIVNDSEPVSFVAEQFCREAIPRTFFEFMFEKCCLEIPSNKSLSILSETSFDKVIEILSSSLPKIVPNVLLAKRDELIPLLLLSIQHNADEKCRDELLHLLFNLIKRPDEVQRQMIVQGFKRIAQNFPSRIESELMPQIWEQIAHKYVERRILIAETCSVLLPYIPGPLRNSLVFSILVQLISDERDIQVSSCFVSPQMKKLKILFFCLPFVTLSMKKIIFELFGLKSNLIFTQFNISNNDQILPNFVFLRSLIF